MVPYWCVTCIEKFYEFHQVCFPSGYYLLPELLRPLPWHSSVTVVNRLLSERSRVRIPSGARDCSLRQRCTPCLGPPSLLFSWVSGIVLWSKEARSVRLTTDPTSGELKNEWCCTSTPPLIISFHVQRQVSILHCLYLLAIPKAIFNIS